MKFYKPILLGFLMCSTACTEQNKTEENPLADESINQLAKQFVSKPAMKYRPYVWWHWMGSNFSKEGITKDLEAMKEAGIGGATIFNLASAVQESHKPIDNNPWPEQTYRSDAYWESMRHAASEAKRLGLKIGIQNTPGYSTTGGPWITEERGMQMVVSTKQEVQGGKSITVRLEQPVPPIYEGWGSPKIPATYYNDIAVLAIPKKDSLTEKDVIDVSSFMNQEGVLTWDVPSGKWTIIRLGNAPTMSNPHPLPDELIGKALEADKMSEEQSVYHWTQFLEPLKEHIGEFLGDSFDHVLIDSYEAGGQNWTKNFKEDFIELKGYDPIPFLALQYSGYHDARMDQFTQDYQNVIHRLFADKGWKVAKKMINEAGMDFYWEPYSGPFDTYEGVGIADLPMGEFWTGSNGSISDVIVKAAAEYGKKIVGAEAFTGSPGNSKYTEDPAFLKPSTDGSFISGVNRLFLHHWVHQPFDDKYQPGMGMGWWGTHFGRNQTWIKPAQAFFTYLARCQMMLQQGKFISTNHKVLHRSSPEAEIYFIVNPSNAIVNQEYGFAQKGKKPELWNAYNGTISETKKWREEQDSVFVTLSLLPHESMFVVFPNTEKTSYKKDKDFTVTEVSDIDIAGTWDIEFRPKLLPSFEQDDVNLFDFSKSSDPKIRYFSGTAIYEKEISVEKSQLNKNKKIILDLGEMNDIAEISVNGENVGVVWNPPYQKDITKYLKSGDNDIRIAVTNNWANRLIGDEQYPADFEWGEDRGDNGRAMKGFPEWFLRNEPRPVKERVGFVIWSYHKKDSPLQPAGLCGPVKLIEQTVQF